MSEARPLPAALISSSVLGPPGAGRNDTLAIRCTGMCWAESAKAQQPQPAPRSAAKPRPLAPPMVAQPVTSALPFIEGAQVYVPASSPPNATVSYQLKSRLGGGLRTLNIPNWEGATDQVTIYWNDFESLNF